MYECHHSKNYCEMGDSLSDLFEIRMRIINLSTPNMTVPIDIAFDFKVYIEKRISSQKMYNSFSAKIAEQAHWILALKLLVSFSPKYHFHCVK